ncbi:enoyl-CoA hydratase-related protein [Pimelobacter simplex]|uniref:enoyl-CoA hydratase-related protein n=1 Tax=Nocardioides simplex TaxID=2045 RepID=UPI001933CD7E|nr:enoyl-CoA hydratase/isomerase family protein [Pimelobacter simplex]
MATVDLAVSAGIATLTFNNPDRKNAITQEMAGQAVDHCAAITEDASIGAVIVRGEGDYFCSGADTRSLAAASRNPAAPEAVATISRVYEVFGQIECLPVPTVAVVTGGVVGAGMNLAMAADVLLTTEDAIFDSGFLERRIHPGGGHIGLLGRSVGRPAAAAMVLLGQPLTGRRIHELGWAHECAPRDDLDRIARELVATAAQDPALVRRIKASLQLELGATVSWAQSLEIERGAQMWSMARKGEEAWSGRGPIAAS